jgi:hypothetical protein
MGTSFYLPGMYNIAHILKVSNKLEIIFAIFSFENGFANRPDMYSAIGPFCVWDSAAGLVC